VTLYLVALNDDNPVYKFYAYKKFNILKIENEILIILSSFFKLKKKKDQITIIAAYKVMY